VQSVCFESATALANRVRGRRGAGVGQERHHGKGNGGEHDADVECSAVGAEQGPHGFDGDIAARAKNDRDHLQRGAFAGLGSLRETASDSGGGGDLDDGVQAEADQRGGRAIVPAEIATTASMTL